MNAVIFFAVFTVALTLCCLIADGLHTFSEARRLRQAPGPHRSAHLPSVERGDRVHRGGGGGPVGEVGTDPHSCSPLIEYGVKTRDGWQLLYRWRCRCGIKLGHFASVEDAIDAHHRHVDIEESIDTMTKGRLA